MAFQFSAFNFMFFVVPWIITASESCRELSPTFYDTSCPNALSTIQTSIRTSISAERRMAASIIRLHFHDCFVQGCDASILLNDTSTFRGEQTAFPNINSIRGLDVIEKAKTAVEKICPGIVSCADILSVAARDSSVAVGGPSWDVKLGRRDSLTANFSLANSDLPGPDSSLENLISRFGVKGLDETDLVALSGAHTIGFSSCVNFRSRIYNSTAIIDPGFASTRKRTCPPSAPDGNLNLAPLDLVTPNSFDNNYYKIIIQKKGLLASDQILLSGGSTDSIVTSFSNTPSGFNSAFAASMIKMADISPLTGSSGEIRRICSAVN